MANEKNIEILKKFLDEKPKVSFEDSNSFPSEEKIYTISGMKRYFRSIGLSNSDLDESMYKIQNDKGTDLKSVLVHNYTYDQKFPYFYISEVNNIADIILNLEKESKELKLNKRVISTDDNLKKAIKKRKKIK